MGGSLEAFKLFLASEKKRSDRADERLRQQQANAATAEPKTDPVHADNSQKETQTAATLTLPTRPAAAASQPATS
ncbi:hypothetical protein H2198_004830 [Neophaeococcomyces mojaviensis]|uniref:Uncharacterized protein n=1 Tax=Neophaeococcomyces mojaviensis TaxID=3383035 RepID=A0ACC3A7F2_9EURO|nr:hypothetical protein H2198_004830 [Knufia sp. JES_112]